MDTKIFKSILTIAVVIAAGAGVTYAQFVSNTVSITGSQATTGDANLKLCNVEGNNNWHNTIAPSLVANNLIPGGAEVELTANDAVYLGNDNGSLNNNLGTDCDSYGAVTPGSSDVVLDVIPTVTNLSCEQESLETNTMLKISLGGDAGVEKSLAAWEANTVNPLINVISPDEAMQLEMFATLHNDETNPNATCTFDINFIGHQSFIPPPFP